MVRPRQLDEAVTREEYDMIAMACGGICTCTTYAETVKARMDDNTLNLKRAIWTWARLVLSRVKAYGNKWYKWYVKQRLWQQKKTKTIPEQYRKYIPSSNSGRKEITIFRQNSENFFAFRERRKIPILWADSGAMCKGHRPPKAEDRPPLGRSARALISGSSNSRSRTSGGAA